VCKGRGLLCSCAWFQPGLDWLGERQRRQPAALPEIGPPGQTVIDRLLARVSELEFCAHGPADFAFWTATRPKKLACDFCFEAAQVLAEDIRCTACGQPAGDPTQDAVVVARVAPWVGAHFYLCALCAELDPRDTRRPR
jgi:hypothetical protein